MQAQRSVDDHDTGRSKGFGFGERDARRRSGDRRRFDGADHGRTLTVERELAARRASWRRWRRRRRPGRLGGGGGGGGGRGGGGGGGQPLSRSYVRASPDTIANAKKSARKGGRTQADGPGSSALSACVVWQRIFARPCVGSRRCASGPIVLKTEKPASPKTEHFEDGVAKSRSDE